MQQTLPLQKKKAAFGNKRIELFYRNKHSEGKLWKVMEDLRENVLDHEGQFISLDLADSNVTSLLETFYAALKNARWERSLPFSLPAILQYNPHVASPFINHAILWQRLSGLLLIDDEPDRPTLLVLENIDLASPTVQHETARLIRFHAAHSVRRTFIFTLDTQGRIIPELRNLFNI
jgi:hypothetical protein